MATLNDALIADKLIKVGNFDPATSKWDRTDANKLS